LQLNSGYSIPVLALGVYQAHSEECYNSVLTALEAGYRHIDSAAWYGNEADVGRAVSAWMKKTGGKREDVQRPPTLQPVLALTADLLYDQIA
jgi:diketogulonate reductase-like aldo/keto reductase